MGLPKIEQPLFETKLISTGRKKIKYRPFLVKEEKLLVIALETEDVKQITNELGYDGGAFFSPDGTKIIFRSSRPKTEQEIKEYKELLKYKN